jgi:AraC-like DNA-binding protein
MVPGHVVENSSTWHRTPFSVSSSVVVALLDAAVQAGVDRDRLIDKAALAKTELDRLDADVEGRTAWRVLELVMEETGDRSFALAAARRLPRGAFMAVEYIVRTSPDLRGGIQQLVRYSRLLGSICGFELEENEPAELLYAAVYDPHRLGSVMLVEFAVASVVQVCREITVEPWSPVSIEFAHRAPPDRGPFASFFGCRIEWRQPQTRVVFPAGLLRQPLRDADPNLNTLLRAFAAEGPAPEQSSTLAHRVREAILAMLPDDEPHLEAVARRLRIAPRVLQARLQEEHTSFQGVLDATRARLAKGYLVRPHLTVPAISLLLGYSEASAFYRAFRRWTGTTPGEYRRRFSR